MFPAIQASCIPSLNALTQLQKRKAGTGALASGNSAGLGWNCIQNSIRVATAQDSKETVNT